MFGAYRVGANTPAYIFTPPVAEECIHKCDVVSNLASDTPNMVNGAMKVSNFFTGEEDGNPISYYRQGANVGGPWIATPAFMRDEIIRLLGEATSVGKDIAKARDRACAIPGGLDLSNRGNNPCGRLNAFISNSWSPYLIELNLFAKKHRSWHSRLWGALYTEIQEYRKRLIGLRQVAVGLGVATTAPAPKLPPKPAIEELGELVRTILYFLVGGLVVWILFKTVGPLFKGSAVAV